MTELQTRADLSREAVERLSTGRDEPDWMRQGRLEAWDLFQSLPMPTRRDEEWRRTDIGKLKLDDLVPVQEAGSSAIESPLGLNGNSGGLLTHQNAETLERMLKDEVRQQGVILTDLETAVQEYGDLVQRYFMTEAVPASYNKFTALNGAFWTGGTFLYVPQGVTVELPLRALYSLSSSGSIMCTHTLLIIEPEARVTFIEEYASNELERQSLNAGVVEVFLKHRAHLTFVTLQNWTEKVFDVSTQRALMERDSQLDWLVIGTGTGITKSNIETALQGPGAHTQMLGILWGHASQHTDYHTVQDHMAPHTTSDLLYKGALTDEARSVFSGRIRVVKGAQGTDAYQANRNILLSDKASSFPSPNLEIEANEVRCTHGATVGKVDDDQLFYLMSRGLTRQAAERMIVEGFFEEVLEREPVGSIRDQLRELIFRKMDLSPIS